VQGFGLTIALQNDAECAVRVEGLIRYDRRIAMRLQGRDERGRHPLLRVEDIHQRHPLEMWGNGQPAMIQTEHLSFPGQPMDARGIVLSGFAIGGTGKLEIGPVDQSHKLRQQQRVEWNRDCLRASQRPAACRDTGCRLQHDVARHQHILIPAPMRAADQTPQQSHSRHRDQDRIRSHAFLGARFRFHFAARSPQGQGQERD